MSIKKIFLLILFLFKLHLFADAHIFVYHRFNDNRFKNTSISTQALKKQFQYLKDHNYSVIPLSKLANAIKKHKHINDHWVVLSIDDGYKSFYTNGLKIFRDFNYTFNLNIYIRAIRKKYNDYLTWEQIKKISKYGEIGIHSYFHPHLVKMDNKQIQYDTNLSINIFKKHLGYKPIIYAYPYGEYNNRVKKILLQYGFKILLNQDNGGITNDSNITNLNRLGLVGDANLKEFLKYTNFKAKLLVPSSYPKDGKITKIVAKIYEQHLKKVKIFITDYGWINANIINGYVKKDLNITLKKRRIRIILTDKFPHINNNLLIKDNI